MRWTCAEMGLPAVATVRCLSPLPDGVAVGSDRGLVLYRGGRFLPFPWPRGARPEPRIEAMALHQGVLHVATTRGRFTWPLSGPVRGQGMPLDGGGVFEEIRAFYSDGDRLHTAWRTHLEPEGPGEVSALVRARGELWAGTLEGRLLRVGGDVERTFSGPVRHLLATPDALLVAAGGALHRFDGSWTQTEGEPYALALHRGQVCTLHRGRLSIDGALDPTPLNRPWCLASTEQGLFVGCVGGLVLR